MSNKNAYNISEEKIREAIEKTTTMGAAAAYLKVNWKTFRKYAEMYNLYKRGAGKGSVLYKTEDILSGACPQYPTSKLSKRLIKEGYKEYKCEECGISEWNGKRIGLELNHIDGDNGNNRLCNLQLLCPNCHSQTHTYKARNINKGRWLSGRKR